MATCIYIIIELYCPYLTPLRFVQSYETTLAIFRALHLTSLYMNIHSYRAL